MALIIDPDNLNQGTVKAVADSAFVAPGVGADATVTSATNDMPALAAGEFFEIRDMVDAENNGLFVVVTVNTSTTSYEVDKVTATAPVTASAEASRFFGATGTASEKSVHFDINQRDIYLLEQGNLSVDGVTEQAVYSFIKLRWKDDNDLIDHPFPMIAITPEQFEFIDDWNPEDNATHSIRSRKLIRTGGWSEVSEVGTVLLRQYGGVITLGAFEDETTDTAYFQQGSDPTDTGAAVDFDFAGPVNEAVLVYQEIAGPDAVTGFGVTINDPVASTDRLTRNDAGSFITDGFQVGGQATIRAAEDAQNNGTFEITAVAATTLDLVAIGGGDPGMVVNAADTTMVVSKDFRNAFAVRLRVRDGDPNGKTFAQANLSNIGVTGAAGMDNKVFRFPISNATDLKIAETDVNIDANTPYTELQIRYLAGAYNREVDTTTKRNFGIIIDVGTYSQSNGATAAVTPHLTSANLTGITLADYTGGNLIIHEGVDQGTHTITGTPVDNAGTLEVTTSVALTGGETNVSFTLQRTSPVTASAEQIYEFVQRQLRRDADIDSTNLTVTGRTADEILRFVGDTLEAGQALPVNPNGGGSGVFIEGFDTNDTNRITFFDNTGAERTFPFVAAGTINFNSNLQADTGPAEYFMYFEYTERFTNTGFGLSAVTVDAATLDSSTTNLVTELADGDYIRLAGFVNPTNNGIFVLTGAPAGAGPYTAAVRKINGDTLVIESAGPSVSMDKNPIDSPDAIIVNNNAGSPIEGNVPGPSVAFDFDYDNNVQGGRTLSTNADIVIRALGTDTAAFVETFGTITQATGLSFSLVAPLERNFSNP
jgi:hypothetical protein